MAVVRLYHGTDALSANDILANGLDAAKAARYNGGGEFWATVDIGVAEWFARTNPSGGQAALLIFEIDEDDWQRIVRLRPSVVVAQGSQEYEFLPACIPLLNQAITNRQVQMVT